MANGSMLPPDVRAQQARLARRQGGIGSAAAENADAAAGRERVMNPDAVVEAEEAKDAAVEVEEAELKECPRCEKKLEDEWNHCAYCGENLMRGGEAKQLGIEWTEDDLNDYLFRGYVARDVPVFGNHHITIKSAQPKDLADIDDYIMNGTWNKKKDGKDRTVSDFYLRQMNEMCIAAASVPKFDGKSIGDTLSLRIEWMSEKGSAFVDIVSRKVGMFNRGLTKYLSDKDTILGS